VHLVGVVSHTERVSVGSTSTFFLFVTDAATQVGAEVPIALEDSLVRLITPSLRNKAVVLSHLYWNVGKGRGARTTLKCSGNTSIVPAGEAHGAAELIAWAASAFENDAVE
jgi:hypothetical protein